MDKSKRSLKAVDGRFAGLPQEPSEADIKAFLVKQKDALADKVKKRQLLKELNSKTELGLRDLNAIVGEIEAERRKKSTNFEKLYPAVNEWDFAELCEYARKRIRDCNAKTPQLFHFSGEMASIVKNEEGSARIQVLNQRQFAHVLNSLSTWVHVKTVGDEEVRRGVSAPNDLRGGRTNLNS